MTVAVVTFDTATGEITGLRHEVDHDYAPAADELVVDDPSFHHAGALSGKRVDTDADPPELVDDPQHEWQRPGVIDPDTHEIIAEQFRAAGADAIQAEQSGDAAAFMRAVIQMQYLIYVALTGDRIQAVEDEYFPVG